GLSVQLNPTTVRLRKMTLDEPLMSTLPSICAPQSPRMVLFEPTLTIPEIVPDTWITAAVDPPAAALSAFSEVTTIGVAEPPPLVPPDDEAHPMGSLSQVWGVQVLPSVEMRGPPSVEPPDPIAPPAPVPPSDLPPPEPDAPPVPLLPPVAPDPPEPVG